LLRQFYRWRFFLKNSLNKEAQSFCKIPPWVLMRWFNFLWLTSLITEPQAPLFWSLAP